ncbi:hypothetical protein FEM48_Zijuj05G0173200 [Ziziphus jujuba var. spinosa]|uniref:YqaJ viral recombinase domain-containing protein n=1 Tax=Ziziphus jujuba var. spinosa TaxID=714518 RepID=A0A978VG44_ZIZJJ|nr:hypothetical protein FEM48_Zijuj05G0173200 [Ziziphus jujuba var. spinosa]
MFACGKWLVKKELLQPKFVKTKFWESLYRISIEAIETFSDSEASVLSTLWSNLQEKEALEFCKRSTGNTVLSPEFQDGNADKNLGDDWLGASSDGIVYELPLRSQGLVQIKCPYFFKPDMANSMANACPCGLFKMKRDAEYENVLKMALSDFWWPAAKHELYRDIVIVSKRIVESSKLLMQEIGGDLRK